MPVREDVSLKQFNTFGIDARTRYFSTFSSVRELEALLRSYQHLPRLMLGGGSNILFIKDFDGIVLKNDISGIQVVGESDDHILLRVGGGENWHRFVMHCVDNNFAGLENLSLIPGNTGATPMQNIGAYGVEVKDVFQELEAYHYQDHQVVKFSPVECSFGYRDSIFKNKYKDQFVILTVTFRLNKIPSFNTSYGAIDEELKRMGVTELNIRVISQAVINIRNAKLPDPKQIGNAGSFFKNPQVSLSQYSLLKADHPGIISFVLNNDTVKLAAGWLIEQCGWKGFRNGDAGCHNRQALVLVNYGNATGQQVYDLSEQIRSSVREKFGVELEREVNVV